MTRLRTGTALLGGRLATGLRDLTDDPAALDGAGFWAVVAPYDAPPVLARFDDVRPAPAAVGAGRWEPVPLEAWTSSLDEGAYTAGVRRLRAEIAAGEVYQANLCRVLSAPCPDPDLAALAAALAAGNPAPHAALVDVPGARVVSASPELFLRREGRRVSSGPIKGTGATAGDLREKDVAENVMIVDLVRHDLSATAVTGSVEVSTLCALEQHPGLVHLVSTVTSELREGAGWAALLATAFPPGSVTGAPKSSATRLIAELEPVPRGPYCGAVGWVDADAGTGELAVAIRTFWHAEEVLHLGVGAGITWGSDPQQEWAETELKARTLLAVAAGLA